MRYSPEGLMAFTEAASLGSFSAAARKLGKRQSTISTAIANLEADLGLVLFDRTARHPVLTDAGHKVLGHVRDILIASERLDALSIRLADKIEPRLTVVLSDSYQLDTDGAIMHRFEQRFQDIELECMVAEDEDVIALLQGGRAHLGIIASQSDYPSDITAARLAHQGEFGIYAAVDHPLAALGVATQAQLALHRELYLKTYTQAEAKPRVRAWSAPDYLTLLAIAQDGFGWAELPRALVQRFGGGRLMELAVRGWPRTTAIDALWSNRTPPGPAGWWLIEQLRDRQ